MADEGEKVRIMDDGRVIVGIGMVVGQVSGHHRHWIAKSLPEGGGGGQYATRLDAIRGLVTAAGYRLVESSRSLSATHDQ